MIEIVAPPPADWPERIVFRRSAGAVLMERDNLVAGSLTVTDWPATLAGIIAALAVIGYAVDSRRIKTGREVDEVTFTRGNPAGWDHHRPMFTSRG